MQKPGCEALDHFKVIERLIVPDKTVGVQVISCEVKANENVSLFFATVHQDGKFTTHKTEY